MRANRLAFLPLINCCTPGRARLVATLLFRRLHPLRLLLALTMLLSFDAHAVIELVIVGEPGQDDVPVNFYPPDDRHVREISDQEIERKGLTSLADVLSQQPGIFVRSMGGEGSFSLLTVRGSSSKQVAVYVDDILINGADGQSVDLSQFALSSIASIKIYPGRQPISFSGQGAAGAIYITTRKASAIRHFEHKIGSYGFRSTALSNGWKSAQGSAFIGLETRRAENDYDLRNDNGTAYNEYDDRIEPRRNQQTRRDSLNLALSRHQLPTGYRSSLNLAAVDQRQQVPNRLNDIHNNAYFDHNRQSLSLKLEQLPARHTAQWISEYSLQWLKTDDAFRDVDSKVGLDGQDNQYLSRRIKFQQQLKGRLPAINATLTSVVALSRENYTNIQRLGSLSFAEDREKFRSDEFNLGLELLHPLPQLGLSLSPQLRFLQRENRDFQAGQNQQQQALSLQISFTQETDDAIWTGFAGRFHRYPGFSELYANHGFSVGNDELKKESVTSLTLGFDTRPDARRGARVKISSEVFVRDSRDLIVISYDARGVGHYDNISRAFIAGLEFKASSLPSARAQWEVAYALTGSTTRSEISSYDGRQTPNTPLHELNLFFSDRLPWLAAVRYRFHLEYTQGAYYDRANLLPVTERIQLDSGLEYRSSDWKLNLSVNNLGNRVNEAFNGFPGPGRTYQLSLSVDF
jgi:iron complex outermembrane receptor protein